MTLLLIPGLLSDRFVWEPVLARQPGVVADLSTQDSITEMAEDCLAAANGPLRVAGHSMGARVAIEMTRLAPGRVARLALLDTGIHPLRDGEPEKRAEIVEFANENGMAALADRWVPGMVATPGRENPAVMEGLRQMVLRMDTRLHARQIKALVDRPDAHTAFSAIKCPVLLAVGRQDQWSPLAQHEAMQRQLPSAQLVVVENAGHFAPVEQPDAVARTLVDFLGA